MLLGDLCAVAEVEDKLRKGRVLAAGCELGLWARGPRI